MASKTTALQLVLLKRLKETGPQAREISMNLIAGGFDLCPVLCMLIAELISNASLRDRFFMIGGDLRKFFLVKNHEVLHALIIYRRIQSSMHVQC